MAKPWNTVMVTVIIEYRKCTTVTAVIICKDIEYGMIAACDVAEKAPKIMQSGH